MPSCNKTENNNTQKKKESRVRRRTGGEANVKMVQRTEQEDGWALDVSISVMRYHPLFAHQTQHLCVVLVFMSELITGRQLPDK